jgi:hypothetical protein
VNWVKNQKNVSVLLLDKEAKDNYVRGDFVGENSESFLCSLEDGIIHGFGQSMIIFHGDPLKRRITELINHLVNQVFTATGFPWA